MLNHQPRNYLRDYRATFNRKPLRPIGEPLVRRLLTERCKHGYIIVNVGRDSADAPADAAHFKKALARIQTADFLWTPIYALCADEATCAKSILVYNQKRGRKAADIADLRTLAASFAAEGRLVSESNRTESPIQTIQAHFAHLQNLVDKHESDVVEIYVNPAPCNVDEATTRAAKGEVFFGRIYG